MRPDEFRSLLQDGPLVADGGTGTSLIERGARADACLDALNLDSPGLVRDVHRSFLDAGAGLVITNTFGASRFNLSRFGLERRTQDINRAGVVLAREAGARIVAGSVGPLRVHLTPYGRVRHQEASEAYREQVAALAEAGADIIVIETQSDLVEIELALDSARRACELAVVVSATFTRDDRMLLGATPEGFAGRVHELGPDAIGVNCSEGPAQVLRLVRTISTAASGVALWVKPNAGGPARVGSRIVWPATPEYFAEHAAALAASGAAVVGGCCGTRPDHVAAIAKALGTPRRPARVEPVAQAQTRAPADRSVVQAPQPTRLGVKLAGKQFITAVEMDPPRGFEMARLLAGAETLADAGADVLNIAGSSRARMRMSPWAPCRVIQEQVGIETIMTFPTRGRNLLRIQGDLLAAHALSIRNVFVCMGDPMSVGDYPDAADSIDITPTGLIGLLKRSFNAGVDQAGEPIDEPTSFVVGCALNPNAPDLRRECRVLRRKVEAGADFALSQPVFGTARLREMRGIYEDRYGPLELPLVLGVQPLVTGRHADFLHNEVPGMSIPDDIRSRMHAAADPAREGTRVAVEVLTELREVAAGAYMLAPFERFGMVAEIIESARL